MLWFISDRLWFSVFELLLVLVAVWAKLKVTVLAESSVVSGVTRGKESREFFSGSASLVLTAVMSVIFTITTFPEDGKVLLYLFNIFLIVYLCMWNGWSTNKLIGLRLKFETRNFNPHRE